MSNIIKKISIATLCVVFSSIALAEVIPHWVKLGTVSDSSYTINTVIDSEEDYPRNSSNQLLQEFKILQNNVKTISRSLMMDCESDQFMVVSAGLLDKNGDFLEKESEKFVNDEDIGELPESVKEKMKVALCKK